MKARDLIPGWPRGRSTSRPLAAGAEWPWVYAHSLTTGELLHVGERIEFSESGLRRKSIQREGRTITLSVTDSQMRQMDAEIEQAEERRKADMMERWYSSVRIATGGWWPHEALSDFTSLLSVMSHTDGCGVVSEEEMFTAVRRTLEWAMAKCANCGAIRDDHIENDAEYPACSDFVEVTRT